MNKIFLPFLLLLLLFVAACQSSSNKEDGSQSKLFSSGTTEPSQLILEIWINNNPSDPSLANVADLFSDQNGDEQGIDTVSFDPILFGNMDSVQQACVLDPEPQNTCSSDISIPNVIGTSSAMTSDIGENGSSDQYDLFSTVYANFLSPDYIVLPTIELSGISGDLKLKAKRSKENQGLWLFSSGEQILNIRSIASVDLTNGESWSIMELLSGANSLKEGVIVSDMVSVGVISNQPDAVEAIISSFASGSNESAAYKIAQSQCEQFKKDDLSGDNKMCEMSKTLLAANQNLHTESTFSLVGMGRLKTTVIAPINGPQGRRVDQVVQAGAQATMGALALGCLFTLFTMCPSQKTFEGLGKIAAPTTPPTPNPPSVRSYR